MERRVATYEFGVMLIVGYSVVVDVVVSSLGWPGLLFVRTVAGIIDRARRHNPYLGVFRSSLSLTSFFQKEVPGMSH